MSDRNLQGDELYDVLFDLESLRNHANKLREESLNLLNGLKILVKEFDKNGLLEKIIRVLKDLVECEHVFILIYNDSNEMVTKASSSEIFYGLCLTPQIFFKRILSGNISISFDIFSIPEWKPFKDTFKNKIQSAIHISLQYGNEKAILVCADSHEKFFTQTHADLIKDYSTLVSQALINLKNKEAQQQLDDKLKALTSNLIKTARQAGMAEIATGVLHNVGNALNSAIVSTDFLREKMLKPGSSELKSLATLLENHSDQLGPFFTSHPQGKLVIQYLSQINKKLQNDQNSWLKELGSLRHSLEHVKSIIAMQQDLAKNISITEATFIPDLVNQIIKMYHPLLIENKIMIEFVCADSVSIIVDKLKVEQIIINLIKNAIDALVDCDRQDKKITIHAQIDKSLDMYIIQVMDNGSGILHENLLKIFNFGFTTKKEGHGYGLHGCFLAAKVMGGTLEVSSPGNLLGAVFTLKLPVQKALA